MNYISPQQQSSTLNGHHAQIGCDSSKFYFYYILYYYYIVYFSANFSHISKPRESSSFEDVATTLWFSPSHTRLWVTEIQLSEHGPHQLRSLPLRRMKPSPPSARVAPGRYCVSETFIIVMRHLWRQALSTRDRPPRNHLRAAEGEKRNEIWQIVEARHLRFLAHHNMPISMNGKKQNDPTRIELKFRKITILAIVDDSLLVSPRGEDEVGVG